MLYEFELSNNAIEPTKSMRYAKDKGAVDHSTVTRWFKKFSLGCKKLNNQAMPGRPKSVDFVIVLLARV